MMFIETSAKEKTGVYEAFEEVVNKVVESPKSSPSRRDTGRQDEEAGDAVAQPEGRRLPRLLFLIMT